MKIEHWNIFLNGNSNLHNQQVASVTSLPTAAPTIRSISTQQHKTTIRSLPQQTTTSISIPQQGTTSQPDCNPTKLCSGSRESCEPQTSCPSFQAEKAVFASLIKGTSERQVALEKLKERICNKSCRYVCCDLSPKWPEKFWTRWWNKQKIWLIQSYSIYKS